MVSPIDCHLHDHIEVACLFGYELEVLQKSGAIVIGIAVTTKTSAGEEFLVVKKGDECVEILMHELEKISVLTPNARFTELDF